jgi:hypothetical protein
MKIALASLIVNDSWNIRSDALCKGRVESYAETFDDLPPLTVALLDGNYHLVDGWHRRAAALSLGREQVEVSVDESLATEADARIAAFKANVRHGVFLTNEQKRRWFEAIKDLRPEYTQTEWAKCLGVSNSTVTNWVRFAEMQSPKRHARASQDARLTVVSIENLSNIWTRWAKSELTRWPVERWSADYRGRVKASLRPIAEFYERL